MLNFFIIILFGVMFLCSGLVVNIFQLLSFIFVLPFSRRYYRLINWVLCDLFWSQLVWLVAYWGRLEIRIYAEPGSFEHLGTEHAIVISNHRSDVDWAVGWVLASWTGCLGGTRALMKKSVQYLPVIGWSLWFAEYIFLARSWAKDQLRMQKGYETLRGFPRPFWLAVFVEGTRFTEEKHRAAQEYAASTGIHVPKHTLVPRTKGFVAAVQSMRSFVPAIYDMIAMVPEGVARPTFLGLIERKPSVIHVYIRRVPTADLPPDDAGVAEWCRKAFEDKDEFLEQHKQTGTFGEDLYVPFKPSIKPTVVTMGWVTLLTVIFGVLIKVAVDAHAALTGYVLAAGAVVLLLVGFIMQRFLVFTQSDQSTPSTKVKATITPPLDGAPSNSKPHTE